jgi:large subunit ribosomal protein L47
LRTSTSKINGKRKSQNWRVRIKSQFFEKLAAEAVKPTIPLPEITHELLRAKFKDLKKGVDNLDYIKKSLELTRLKKERREHLNQKYDYELKKIAPLGQDVGI